MRGFTWNYFFHFYRYPYSISIYVSLLLNSFWDISTKWALYKSHIIKFHKRKGPLLCSYTCIKLLADFFMASNNLKYLVNCRLELSFLSCCRSVNDHHHHDEKRMNNENNLISHWLWYLNFFLIFSPRTFLNSFSQLFL